MDGILEQLPVFGDVQDPSDPNSPVTQVTPMGFPTFRDKPSYKLQSLLAGKAREDSDEAQGFLFDQFKIEQQKMIENALQQYQEQTQSIQEVLRTPPPKPAKAQLSRGQQIAAAIGTIIAPNQAGEIATHLMGRAHEDADKLTEQQMNEWKASQMNAVRELKSAEDIRNFRMEMQSNLATQELQIKLNEIKERRQEKDGATKALAHAFDAGNVIEYNLAMQKLAPSMTDEEIQKMDADFNEKVKQINADMESDRAYKAGVIANMERDDKARAKKAGQEALRKVGYKPRNELTPEEWDGIKRDAIDAGVKNPEVWYDSGYADFDLRKKKIDNDIAKSREAEKLAREKFNFDKYIRSYNAQTGRINALKTPKEKGVARTDISAYIKSLEDIQESLLQNALDGIPQVDIDYYRSLGSSTEDAVELAVNRTGDKSKIAAVKEWRDYGKKLIEARKMLTATTEGLTGGGNQPSGGNNKQAALDKLKALAKSGDKQAQGILTANGIKW